MTQSFLKITDLHRHFLEGGRRHSVLNGVNLEVASGEKVALLGRSGSGKSTLLNLIAAIDRPDQGRVSVDGCDLGSLSERQRTLFRRRRIGYVYQFFNLIPTLTAAENIALALELNRFSKAQIKQRVQSLLTAIGLEQRGQSFPDQLSGGEQQRVAIARALAHEPALVLADEPTGNLDAETGRRVLELLHQLVGNRRGTLVMVTHSLAVASSADRLLTLENGLFLEQTDSLARERAGKLAW
ncbi:MAG: ABC transporter ATP-binding protein [Exilibacterium sp.]